MKNENPIFQNHQELNSVISEQTLLTSKLVFENELFISSLIDSEVLNSNPDQKESVRESKKQGSDGTLIQ
ncbi:MAG: hypothetical protein VX341_13825 [Bdellovibrionota bacterium]|nr:hypothetical protein [Bdellovibrionota bacterium]